MEIRKNKMENFKKKKVLFICTHNSARSQMAEGILRSLYPERYEAYSAGTEPTELNPYTIEVMREMGIDISRQRSKSINEFSNKRFDYVITVCGQAKESCPFFPEREVIHQGFLDPSQLKGTEEKILEGFRKVRDEIKEWIEKAFEDNDLEIQRNH